MSIVEFCTNCAKELGQPIKIDVQEIFDGLDKNKFKKCHCASCSLMTIANYDGDLMVSYAKKPGQFKEYIFI